ncbi:MAG: DMT family transporter [Rhodospirillales bacterium]|nr:MAG: DMT family transporter [Rhodospirillales bacterium]
MVPSRYRLALPFLFLGAIGIGFAPIFVRLSELGPITTAFYRLFLALPALWLWLALAERGRPTTAPRPRRTGDWLGLLAAGLFFAGDLSFWHWSIRLTSVANATLLANFAPVFVALAGFLLFAERFSRTFMVGMAMALIGACVLMGESVTIGASAVLGDVLGLTAAVFYAGYIVAVARLRARFSTPTIMAWSSLITCAALFPTALVSGEDLVPVTLYGWGVLVGLALVSQVGGQSLIAFALAHLPAAFSAVSLLLQPAVAALLAWILLDEALGPVQGAGALMILAGILVARRGSRTPAAAGPHPGPDSGPHSGAVAGS